AIFFILVLPNTSGVVKPLLHYFERRHLLGYKENLLALVQCGRDDVGDCLTLSRAGWALNNHVTPAHYIDDGGELRRVRFGDQRWHFPSDLGAVHVILFCE